MKTLARIATFAVLCFGLYASAQTTTYSVPNTACQAYSANYRCGITLTPTASVSYEPWYNQQFDQYGVEFWGDLAGLGAASITSVTSPAPLLIYKVGTPNKQGYQAIYAYSEKTTFTGRDGAYTGSSTINYTTTTQCCSSGRGPSQHTVWTITSGSITIQQ